MENVLYLEKGEKYSDKQEGYYRKSLPLLIDYDSGEVGGGLMVNNFYNSIWVCLSIKLLIIIRTNCNLYGYHMYSIKNIY